ncbi:MAG: hypothetical protein ABFS18_02505 [Thermodesulfobacteriota bacterium]
MIRAGTTKEIKWDSGNWVFLDIGFANKSSSCGLLFGNDDPDEVTFNEATEIICEYLSKQQQATNLVIEAPLSVSFDLKGNPKGRKPEKQNGKTRYWYVGLGCTVLVATFYLIKSITDSKPPAEVRLFEGFVSFKSKGKVSNHSKDVLLLRRAVKKTEPWNIISPKDLRMDETDVISSAFKVGNMDYGVPPIIQNHDELAVNLTGEGSIDPTSLRWL